MEALFDTVEAVLSYPRKLIVTYDSWDELKQFIFSNMLVYFGLLLLVIGFDPISNLLRVSGFNLFPHEVDVHPYFFGKGQMVAAVFFLTQSWRHFSAWRCVS